jgi:hypothetical protein
MDGNAFGGGEEPKKQSPRIGPRRQGKEYIITSNARKRAPKAFHELLYFRRSIRTFPNPDGLRVSVAGSAAI